MKLKRIKMFGKKLNIILRTVALAVGMALIINSEASAITLSNPQKSTGYEFCPTTWNYVYFGTYPQSEVTDSKIISQIESGLKSLGKSSGDVRVGEYRYRKVTQVRKHYIDENTSKFRYVKENHYYKWERIKWRVLNVSNNKALLVSDKAIDVYQISSNTSNVTWNNSQLRTYLNESFYNTAFSGRDKNAIVITTVSNAEYSPERGSQFKFVKNLPSTQDKVFILSTDDLLNSNYGYGEGVGTGLKSHLNRNVIMTDYVGIDEEAGMSSADNTGKYWARTSASENKLYTCWNGRFQYNKSSDCHLCIVPAVTISLTEEKCIVKTTFNNTDSGKNLDGNDIYEIKYSLKGGINSDKNPTTYCYGNGVSKLFNPTRKGYTFKGWYKDAEYKNKITSISKTAARDMKLYAKWEKYYPPDSVRAVKVIQGKATYRITIKGQSNITDVAFYSWSDSKSEKLVIPDTITYNGKRVDVTSVYKEALKKKSNLKTLVIGSNISKIGDRAFYGCRYLKTITIKSEKLTASKLGIQCFGMLNSQTHVKVPKGRIKYYKVILVEAGLNGENQTISYK